MLTAPEVRDWAAAATSGRGFVAELSGHLATAEHRHREAYLLAKDVRHVGAAARAVAVEELACVAAARGDGQSTATLLGTAARWRAEAHGPATPLELHDIERAGNRARTLLSPNAAQPGRLHAGALSRPDRAAGRVRLEGCHPEPLTPADPAVPALPGPVSDRTARGQRCR